MKLTVIYIGMLGKLSFKTFYNNLSIRQHTPRNIHNIVTHEVSRLEGTKITDWHFEHTHTQIILWNI